MQYVVQNKQRMQVLMIVKQKTVLKYLFVLNNNLVVSTLLFMTF